MKKNFSINSGGKSHIRIRAKTNKVGVYITAVLGYQNIGYSNLRKIRCLNSLLFEYR